MADVTIDQTIRQLLTETTTWAVVGLSTNQARPAHGVAAFLQARGKRIVTSTREL